MTTLDQSLRNRTIAVDPDDLNKLTDLLRQARDLGDKITRALQTSPRVTDRYSVRDYPLESALDTAREIPVSIDGAIRNAVLLAQKFDFDILIAKRAESLINAPSSSSDTPS
jgi:hypothetical protein